MSILCVKPKSHTMQKAHDEENLLDITFLDYLYEIAYPGTWRSSQGSSQARGGAAGAPPNGKLPA